MKAIGAIPGGRVAVWTALGCSLLTAALGQVAAQQYVISIVAGETPPPAPGCQVDRSILGIPNGVATDSAGNAYFTSDNCVFKLDQNGVATSIAGSSRAGFSGNGGPASTAQLFYPNGVAVDGAGNVYVTDWGNNVVRVLRPTNRSLSISAVVDAASERADPISPGKIVVIYGAGLGPAQLIQNQASNGQFGTGVGGTVVSFNGIAAPILYASATAVAVIVPYAISGTTAQVTVTYRGEISAAFPVPVATSAPSLFTSNETGSGQAAIINSVDGTVNTAANPVRIGDSILLYATGEGQTSPSGVDGKLGGPSGHTSAPAGDRNGRWNKGGSIRGRCARPGRGSDANQRANSEWSAAGRICAGCSASRGCIHHAGRGVDCSLGKLTPKRGEA